MKLSAIIVTVLTIIATAHGFDKDRKINFQQHIQTCLLLSNKTSARTDAKTLKCALQSDGQIFDNNGQIIKVQMLTLILDIIRDGYQSMMAQTLFRDCYRQAKVQDNIISDEETMKMIECFFSIINYVTE